jgi:hypothetical protein
LDRFLGMLQGIARRIMMDIMKGPKGERRPQSRTGGAGLQGIRREEGRNRRVEAPSRKIRTRKARRWQPANRWSMTERAP